MKLSRVKNGRLRAVNSYGCYMVSPEEFRLRGWNTDTARWAKIGEEVLKVAIVSEDLVWERRKGEDTDT